MTSPSVEPTFTPEDRSDSPSLLWGAIGVSLVATLTLVGYFLAVRFGNQNWDQVKGFNFVNLNKAHVAYFLRNFFADHGVMKFVTEPHVSLTGEWGIVVVAALSWALLLLGEKRFAIRRARASKFVPFAVLAALTSLGVVALVVNQLRGIPLLLVPQGPTNLLVHVPYGTAMISFGILFIVQFVGLAAVAGTLAVRAQQGGVTWEYRRPIERAVTLWGVIVLTTAVVALVTQVAY